MGCRDFAGYCIAPDCTVRGLVTATTVGSGWVRPDAHGPLAGGTRWARAIDAAHPRRACRERFGLSVAGALQRARGDPRGAGARGAHLRERVGGSRAALGGASRRYDAHDDATVDLWRARLSLTARRSDGNRLTPLPSVSLCGAVNEPSSSRKWAESNASAGGRINGGIPTTTRRNR